MKYQGREIGSLNYCITLKSDWHISNSSADVPIKISERSDNSTYKSHGFETLWDLTYRILKWRPESVIQNWTMRFPYLTRCQGTRVVARPSNRWQIAYSTLLPYYSCQGCVLGDVTPRACWTACGRVERRVCQPDWDWACCPVYGAFDLGLAVSVPLPIVTGIFVLLWFQSRLT